MSNKVIHELLIIVNNLIQLFKCLYFTIVFKIFYGNYSLFIEAINIITINQSINKIYK